MENTNGEEWRQKIFERIISMKMMYLPHLKRFADKLHHEYSLLQQQQRSDQFEKTKQWKTWLEQTIKFLSVSKSDIMPYWEGHVDDYKDQIIRFFEEQLTTSQIQPMQQSQSETVQDQSHDNDQANLQMQSMSMQDAWLRAQQSKQGVLQPLLQEFGKVLNDLDEMLGWDVRNKKILSQQANERYLAKKKKRK